MLECDMDGANAQMKTNQSYRHDMEVGKNRIDASRIGEGGRERKILTHVKPCNECHLDPKWFHIHIMKFQPNKQN